MVVGGSFDTFPKLLLRNAAQFGSRPAFRHKDLGIWQTWTWTQVTEIVRAGVQSIESGQWEAAGSLGLSRLQTLRLVVLPQAIQRVVPPLAGQFISLVKDSSIVSLISIQELTFLGNEVAASTGRPVSWCSSAA